MIVILTNKDDSMALLLEAEQQGLMEGDYVFFLVQHFEVSGSVVSKHFHFTAFAELQLHRLSRKTRFGRWENQPPGTPIDGVSGI